MYGRRADYRVASNRELFEYPMDKAISLLKALETENQGEIIPETLRGEKNLITRVSNFFGISSFGHKKIDGILACM